MNSHQTKGIPAFTLVQEFNAPRELVFNAFGNADALNEWWGPAESRNSVIKLEFRPGGIFHFKMEFGKAITYGRFVFGNIHPHDLLEFTNAFVDKHANIVKPPFDIDLPREIFYQLGFSENRGKTTITLTGRPVNASPNEMEAFWSIAGDMQQGFGKTFNKLAAYLNKQKNK